jgi:hypothetical protein
VENKIKTKRESCAQVQCEKSLWDDTLIIIRQPLTHKKSWILLLHMVKDCTHGIYWMILEIVTRAFAKYLP